MNACEALLAAYRICAVQKNVVNNAVKDYFSFLIYN